MRIYVQPSLYVLALKDKAIVHGRYRPHELTKRCVDKIGDEIQQIKR